MFKTVKGVLFRVQNNTKYISVNQDIVFFSMSERIVAGENYLKK